MAKFTVNAQRVDPYKDFKFRVKWDGVTSAALTELGLTQIDSVVA